MAFNPYLHEKLIAERHAEIRHTMQQSRKQIPIRSGQQRTPMSYAVDRLGTLLIALGSPLQRIALPGEAYCTSSYEDYV